MAENVPRRPRRARPTRRAPRAPTDSASRANATGATDARELLSRLSRTLDATWRTLAPHAARALAFAARVPISAFGLLMRHRLVAFRVSHRVMWWAALVVLFVAGRALLGGLETAPWVDRVHVQFTVGLILCAMVLVLAAERRLRVAAFVLGTGHGAFALLAWLVSQP